VAHDCPDCGSACYCSGDVDDILIQDGDAQTHCSHCRDECTCEDDCEDFEEAP
jgi:hypothetical protein